MNKESLTSGSMVCEIINPSDPYTLRTDDFEVAAVAIAILGNGKLGLRSLDDEHRSPVLFGWDDWFTERGITDLNAYTRDHAAEIATTLESILIGDVNFRAAVESMARLIPDEQLQQWLDERHDRERSSLNDIGQAAWRLAKRFREHLTAVG